jgi:putative ABC transport system ATP-binding protein
MIIKATNIGKKFNDDYIFRHLNFELTRGEMVAFTGESGCGKTTLVNCIGQLEDLTEGTISIADTIITPKQRQALFRNTFGFLFQNFALIDNETIGDNLKLVSHDKAKMRQLLEEFGLDHALNTKIYKLSGGEQQRVALIRLILKNPAIVIADEPTASLDKGNGRIVMQTLKTLSRAGKTVLVVTHDEALLEYFDTVIDLNKLKANV